MEQQSREARSKDPTLPAAPSTPKAPESTDTLPAKSADNPVKTPKDSKDNTSSADKKSATVGKFSVTPTKDQAADDSAQDLDGDCEEDVDLEARKRVEELKERLKAGR